jgi:hypothetical protein
MAICESSTRLPFQSNAVKYITLHRLLKEYKNQQNDTIKLDEEIKQKGWNQPHLRPPAAAPPTAPKNGPSKEHGCNSLIIFAKQSKLVGTIHAYTRFRSEY